VKDLGYADTLVKVKVVFHPKLKHLVDVVVFPTRGTFPLAGKLQGGDYDGDKVKPRCQGTGFSERAADFNAVLDLLAEGAD